MCQKHQDDEKKTYKEIEKPKYFMQIISVDNRQFTIKLNSDTIHSQMRFFIIKELRNDNKKKMHDIIMVIPDDEQSGQQTVIIDPDHDETYHLLLYDDKYPDIPISTSNDIRLTVLKNENEYPPSNTNYEPNPIDISSILIETYEDQKNEVNIYWSIPEKSFGNIRYKIVNDNESLIIKKLPYIIPLSDIPTSFQVVTVAITECGAKYESVASATIDVLLPSDLGDDTKKDMRLLFYCKMVSNPELSTPLKLASYMLDNKGILTTICEYICIPIQHKNNKDELIELLKPYVKKWKITQCQSLQCMANTIFNSIDDAKQIYGGLTTLNLCIETNMNKKEKDQYFVAVFYCALMLIHEFALSLRYSYYGRSETVRKREPAKYKQEMGNYLEIRAVGGISYIKCIGIDGTFDGVIFAFFNKNTLENINDLSNKDEIRENGEFRLIKKQYIKQIIVALNENDINEINDTRWSTELYTNSALLDEEQISSFFEQIRKDGNKAKQPYFIAKCGRAILKYQNKKKEMRLGIFD